MKLTMILLLVGMLQVSANVYSQNGKISVEANEMELSELLWQLQESSGIVFVYKTKDLKGLDKVSVNKESVSIEEILDEVLDDTNLEYKLNDDVVVIKQKEVNRSSQQQDSTLIITGKVVDEKGESMPGVTIQVQGKMTGRATDMKGLFSMRVLATDTLRFSFVGFETQSISVANKKQLSVTLISSSSEIDEVVVTGIFNRKASTFTGAVTSIKGDALKSVSNSNVFESIKNLDPSLMILDNMSQGSDPNAMPEMQLRGSSSMNLNPEETDIKGIYGTSANAPLFILDGFQATVEKIIDLDMDRVESITILKDASAKTIYGSKAANGVIVIETKTNQGGKALVSYNVGLSVEVPDLTSYNLMNAAEKLQFEVDYGLYGGGLFSEDNGTNEEKFYQSKLRAVKEGVDTDWLSKPLRNGIGTKHRLAFQLGDKAVKLIAGFTYNNIQGTMIGSSRKNYSGDINISYRYNKLNLRNQLSITNNISNDSPYGSFSEYSKMNPYYSPYDRDGNIVEHPPLKTGNEEHSQRYYIANPLWNSQLSTKLEKQYLDISNNLYAQYFFTDNLRTSVRMGIALKRVEGDRFYPADHTKFRNYTTEDLIWRRGSYQVNEGRSRTLSGDFNTTYSKNFTKHYLMFNVGMQFSEMAYDEVVYKAEGLPSEDMNSIMFAKQYMEGSKPTGKEETRREIGGLGVINYAFDNRFLFDASIRSTGSSQYGANKRWGTFWSSGIGWNIHNEHWLSSSNIQQLKLRASIGTTGSQIPTAYAGSATYKYILDKTYNNLYGLSLMGMRNDDLQWQRKFDKNVGLELNMFNRLSIVIDAYEAITENTLIQSSIAPSTGFSSVDENMGEIVNKGIELKTTYTAWSKPKDRSFLTFRLTAAHNKNEIRKLSDAMNAYNARIDELFDKDDRVDTRPLNKYYEGASTTSIWAVPSKGIDPANGREIFIKEDGTRTYNYKASDQRVLGNTLPDVHGNIGTSFQYKGFGINVGFYYTYGGQMYNYTLAEKVEGYDIKYNVDRRVLDGAWKNAGDVKPYAPNNRLVSWNWARDEGEAFDYTVRGSAPTGRFVFDRNELSLSSLNISYDFWRHSFIKKIGLSRLKVSAFGNNLYTWSSVKIERGTSYPFARTFNFAVSATF